MSIMRMVAAVGLTAWLFKILRIQTNQSTNKQSKKTSQLLFVPVLILLSVAIISSLISRYKWVSLGLLANLFVYAGVYFIVINNLKNRTQAYGLIAVMLLVSLFLGVYGLFQYFDIVIKSPPRLKELRGLPSTYYNSNHYAGYLAMITPIPVALFLFSPWSRFSLFIVLLSILVVINLILCYPLGIIGLGVGVAFLVFVKIYYSRRKKLVTSLILLAIISFVILGAIFVLNQKQILPKNTLTGRYTYLKDWAHRSIKGRFCMYKRTIPYILDHPYLGTGIGTFVYAFPQYRPPE